MNPNILPASTTVTDCGHGVIIERMAVSRRTDVNSFCSLRVEVVTGSPTSRSGKRWITEPMYMALYLMRGIPTIREFADELIYLQDYVWGTRNNGVQLGAQPESKSVR